MRFNGSEGEMVEVAVDPSAIDLRHESRRLRHSDREMGIFDSMITHGLSDALLGIKADSCIILLDGFKRYRAAKIVGLQSLRVRQFAENELEGIVSFVRQSVQHGIHILEEAAFIEYLEKHFTLSSQQIAHRLHVSKGWVSMRLRLLSGISEFVRQKLFRDEFPAYAYMYYLSRFIRMNEASQEEVDRFVHALSGKKLSLRDIERLAYGYFKGPKEFRVWIDGGNIIWALNRSRGLMQSDHPSLSDVERIVLADMESLLHGILRLERLLKNESLDFKNSVFLAQANLLAGHLIEKLPSFTIILEGFHARSRNT